METEAAEPAKAAEHFRSKLAFETDPSDVYADIQNGEARFLVVDARTPEAYALGHVPGAVSLWHRKIGPDTTASLPKDKVLVTYCAGVHCNASTKAAGKLAALGFRVKEMLNGIEGWKAEGYPVETGTGSATVEKPVRP